MRLRQDLPISINDRVILPFCEVFIFTKLRICFPNSRGRFRSHSQSKIPCLFFPIKKSKKKKKKKKKKKNAFFRDQYYLWKTMAHIRHLCLSGMLGIIQSEITISRIYFAPLICSMLLIFPNFVVKSVMFFPILARGLFPKLQEKALTNKVFWFQQTL